MRRSRGESCALRVAELAHSAGAHGGAAVVESVVATLDALQQRRDDDAALSSRLPRAPLDSVSAPLGGFSSRLRAQRQLVERASRRVAEEARRGFQQD